MLANSVDVCAAARELGALIVHAPISFAKGPQPEDDTGSSGSAPPNDELMTFFH